MLRAGLPDYAKRPRLPAHHWRILRALIQCRTPALDGHLYQCRHCGKEHFVPHSCRNRHCPTCQGARGYDWVEQQADVLLPIPYFHLVFTLPHALNPLIQQNQARFYDLLFAAASATLLEFGRQELGAQIGLTAVLHTWSQTLLDHDHLHCHRHRRRPETGEQEMEGHPGALALSRPGAVCCFPRQVPRRTTQAV